MAQRFQVSTTERDGVFHHSLVDTSNGTIVFEEGQELSYYFDAASMLNGGFAPEEVRERLAVRPIGKKCGC